MTTHTYINNYLAVSFRGYTHTHIQSTHLVLHGRSTDLTSVSPSLKAHPQTRTHARTNTHTHTHIHALTHTHTPTLVCAQTKVGSINAGERKKIKDIIDAGVTDNMGISTDMFDVVQRAAFKEMFYNTFQRFASSPEYARMHADIKNAYNKVGVGVGVVVVVGVEVGVGGLGWALFCSVEVLVRLT